MNKYTIETYTANLDKAVHMIKDDSGESLEVWHARDLQVILGYERWQSFQAVIERAMESCKAQNINVADHFGKTTTTASLNNGATRELEDYLLTRYACYLIAQNGDPKKEAVAFAQSYFAVQTRKVEVIESQINALSRLDAREKLKASEKALSKIAYEHGVDDRGFAMIRSKGDEALFGISTLDMKKRLGIKKERPLADFLPTLTIAAKNLATEMTNHNIEQRNLQGEHKITSEHVGNNSSVRRMLEERGIKPEDLPAEEDIKKTSRRIAANNKQIFKGTKGLPKGKQY